MAQFIVKGAVKYQGKLYNSGSVVEVEDKHVEEFKKHGWEIVKGKKQEPQGNGDGEVKLTDKSKKEEIIAELEKRGIEHDPKANKADLLALLA